MYQKLLAGDESVIHTITEQLDGQSVRNRQKACGDFRGLRGCHSGREYGTFPETDRTLRM